MTFDQVMTVVAVAAGPVGIGLGWGLSELGEAKRAKAAAKERADQGKADRAIRILAAAASADAEGRNLAHAAYLKGARRPADKGQVMESMDTFNAAMRDLDRLILEADVFGPDGLADIGRTLRTCARDLVKLVTDMEIRLTNNDVDKVQKETLPAFEAAITTATEDIRTLLAKDS